MNHQALAKRIQRAEKELADRRQNVEVQKLSAEDRKKTEDSLYQFVQEAWHVMEPATEYVDGWHIKAVCDHLEAVADGRIQDLLINIPPRHMKSLSVAVFGPCWDRIAR